MCNRYVSPAAADMERAWQLTPGEAWRGGSVFPNSAGPFIRPHRGSERRELVIGRWGLIPDFAKTARISWSTNNARSEEMATKATYKTPWRQGQRCIIPAVSFDEPNWETGRNVWWTFRRADGGLWALAGLWNTWTDRATGEAVESYTMCTINADAHPLMSRMHKPDPTLAPDAQDKRSVVVIEAGDIDTWLHGSEDDARALLRLSPAEHFAASPAPDLRASGRRTASGTEPATGPATGGLFD
jgi:putative SOS response-associated peptidase YedK